MPLLNYTTSVAADRTAAQVERLLVTAGARQVIRRYDDDGTTAGLAFHIELPGGPRSFVLPVDVDAVWRVLTGQNVAGRYSTREHAARVAWRILKDWTEAQLAIIETEMVAFDQVMLPYMQVGADGETAYDLYLAGRSALPA